MSRKPEIGNVQVYPKRPLRKSDKNGYVLKFYCPIKETRIRKSCGTRNRREAGRVQRQCRERLLNGEYVASNGAITKQHEIATPPPIYARDQDDQRSSITWDEVFEQYRAYKVNRMRKQSYQSLTSRINMCGRIFEARRANEQLAPGATLEECMSLVSLEYLQDQLLDGAEGRYDSRQPVTVNSMMGDVLAFARYCYAHEWIAKVPPLRDLDEDEPMRGRSITGEEFDRMIERASRVVGETAAKSWVFLLNLLWESGFRIAEVLNFSWDNETKIHPRWNTRHPENSTLVFPSTQKNRKTEEIPMLPGLRKLLESVPEESRVGRVVKLEPIEYTIPAKKPNAFIPNADDLTRLIVDYSNSAIANACGVSDRTVGVWLKKLGLARRDRIRHYGEGVPAEVVSQLKNRRQRRKSRSANLSKDRVSRIVSAIGEEAGIIVRHPDPDRGLRIKYASAHDLRRSLAERLYNRGISAETLMVIMRHRSFSTTRKFYQAKKRAESAAAEVNAILGREDTNRELVGGLVGGTKEAPQLSTEELEKYTPEDSNL